jgi:hypothetical protein
VEKLEQQCSHKHSLLAGEQARLTDRGSLDSLTAAVGKLRAEVARMGVREGVLSAGLRRAVVGEQQRVGERRAGPKLPARLAGGAFESGV